MKEKLLETIRTNKGLTFLELCAIMGTDKMKTQTAMLSLIVHEDLRFVVPEDEEKDFEYYAG